MKVALCLSGQARNFDMCVDSINEQFVKQYFADIFIHVWHDESKSGQVHDRVINAQNKEFLFVENLDQKLIQCYHPKKMIVEKPMSWTKPEFEMNEINDAALSNPKNFSNRISMLHSMYHSNKLKCEYEKDNAVKYDYVVRSRFDLVFSSKITLENNEMISIIDRPVKELDDRFAFSSSENMDYYCSLYEVYEKYLKQGIPPCNHYLLTEHLKNKKVHKIGGYQTAHIVR